MTQNLQSILEEALKKEKLVKDKKARKDRVLKRSEIISVEDRERVAGVLEAYTRLKSVSKDEWSEIINFFGHYLTEYEGHLKKKGAWKKDFFDRGLVGVAKAASVRGTMKGVLSPMKEIANIPQDAAELWLKSMEYFPKPAVVIKNADYDYELSKYVRVCGRKLGTFKPNYRTVLKGLGRKNCIRGFVGIMFDVASLEGISEHETERVFRGLERIPEEARWHILKLRRFFRGKKKKQDERKEEAYDIGGSARVYREIGNLFAIEEINESARIKLGEFVSRFVEDYKSSKRGNNEENLLASMHKIQRIAEIDSGFLSDCIDRINISQRMRGDIAEKYLDVLESIGSKDIPRPEKAFYAALALRIFKDYGSYGRQSLSADERQDIALKSIDRIEGLEKSKRDAAKKVLRNFLRNARRSDVIPEGVPVLYARELVEGVAKAVEIDEKRAVYFAESMLNYRYKGKWK